MAKTVDLKHQQNRFSVMRNGIDLNEFNPYSREMFGDLEFPENGSSEEIYNKKQEIKNILFELGIIPDPIKPLLLYVGRFDVTTKGVDVLPHIYEETINQQAQLVIMGLHLGISAADAIINDLKDKAINSNSLNVIDSLDKQKVIAGNTGVPTGMLVRLAADIVTVPSRQEADGQVPKEAIALISSGANGLKGMLTDFKGLFYPDFNAFLYDDKTAYTTSKVAVSKAISYYKDLPKSDQGDLIKRLITSANRFDWSKVIEKVHNVYPHVLDSSTIDLDNRISLVKNLSNRVTIYWTDKTLLDKLIDYLFFLFKEVINFISAGTCFVDLPNEVDVLI